MTWPSLKYQLLAPFIATIYLIGGPAVHAADNILLILADDYGVDVSRLYIRGGDIPPAPTIEQLAREGYQFNRGWSYPSCSPARASIITGQYGFRTGVLFALDPPSDSTPVGGIDVTSPYILPKVLNDAGLGYVTAAIGKWHLTTGPNLDPLLNDPYEAGFDYFAGSIEGEVDDYFDWPKVINEGATVIGPTTSTVYATTDQIDEAVGFIEAQGANPWFMYLALNAPHSPFQLPPEDLVPPSIVAEVEATVVDPYQEGFEPDADLPALELLRQRRLVYKAMIAAMDKEIRRLLASVNRTKTVIFFIGDNGTPNEVSVPPFPPDHAKATLFQGGVHVPLIAVNDHGSLFGKRGIQSNALVESVDLYATIIESAGINVATAIPDDYTLDSVSFSPVLSWAWLFKNFSLRRTAYTEQDTTPPNSCDDDAEAHVISRGEAVRDHRFKLIHNNDPVCAPREEFELYDLQKDPLETTELLANPQHPFRERFQFRKLCRTLNKVREEQICDGFPF